MKRIYILSVFLLVICFVRGDGAITNPQDVLNANPKTILLKLENSRVRVLEATLKPGAKEAIHSHPAYVIYVIDGGKVRNHAADGKTTETELKSGEVLYRDPLTHWAENIGTTTMHMILVELKTGLMRSKVIMDTKFLPAVEQSDPVTWEVQQLLVADSSLATSRSSTSHPTLLQCVALTARTNPTTSRWLLRVDAGAEMNEPLVAAASVTIELSLNCCSTVVQLLTVPVAGHSGGSFVLE
jgi:quercetin dioxygenase-like cupin family protein